MADQQIQTMKKGNQGSSIIVDKGVTQEETNLVEYLIDMRRQRKFLDMDIAHYEKELDQLRTERL